MQEKEEQRKVFLTNITEYFKINEKGLMSLEEIFSILKISKSKGYKQYHKYINSKKNNIESGINKVVIKEYDYRTGETDTLYRNKLIQMFNRD